MSKLDELKKLALKVTSASTVADVTGDRIADVLAYIAANFVTKEKGDDGADGLSVTAIELETTEGAVTGGTATMSDGSSIEITVTAAD